MYLRGLFILRINKAGIWRYCLIENLDVLGVPDFKAEFINSWLLVLSLLVNVFVRRQEGERDIRILSIFIGCSHQMNQEEELQSEKENDEREGLWTQSTWF